MGLFFSLLFALFLARTSSIRLNQEADQSKHPGFHLPLYNVRGRAPHSLQSSDTTMSFSEILALDDARVKFLNSRLTNKNSTSVHPSSNNLINRNSVSTVPLNPGVSLNALGYYSKIGLGTPPTDHLVLIDTGSSFSWIQCEPCAAYCHPQVGSVFNPSASNTYQKLSCDTNQCSSLKDATLNSPACSSSNTCIYTSSYGDQSFSRGYLSQDSLSFGTDSHPGFVFGCGQDNEGRFGKLAGIFGLAKDPLSLLSQLSTKDGNAFSYCLPTSKLFEESGSGGFLSIGTTSSSNSGYKFTPMLSDSRVPSLYFLKLSSILVSGQPLSVAAGEYNVPTFIDSGTTISRLAMPVYSALTDVLVKIISSKYTMSTVADTCFVGSGDEIYSVVPSVQLVFEGGAEVNLKPQNVVIEVEKGTTCLSFAPSSDIAVIGNQQQQTFEVVYDIASSRIGFAAGGCS